MEPTIEGPARNRDLSYGYLQKFEALQEAEKGIPMIQFLPYMKLRDLELEFRLLKKITETREHAQMLCENSPETMAENRYPDVLPYRDTIVRLSSGSYMNADLVDGAFQESAELFIVTQGPLYNTKAKFWDMVWESRVSLIVMSCQMMEAGQEKCEQYFPVAEEITVGPYTIEMVKSKEKRVGLIRRRFVVRKEDSEESLDVEHVQWMNWQDHCAPDIEADVGSLDYMIETMKERTIAGRKLLVHCSAGCGRSGAIVGIYCMVTALESLLAASQSPRVSVFGTVRRLREQRWGMVQTKEQYVFLYAYMEHWITRRLAEGTEEESV